MRLPNIKSNPYSKSYQMNFGGYDHREGADDGTFFDMANMTSNNFPLIMPRAKRKIHTVLTIPNGLVGGDNLAWVDGEEFFYNGISKGAVADSKKHMVEINNLICIFPDNKCYDITNDKLSNLGYKYTSGLAEISFEDGEYGNSYSSANSISTVGTEFSDFEVGDAIKITGATSDKNNSPYNIPIIREISEDKKTLRFYEYIFDLDNSTSYKEKVLEENWETFSSLAFYVSTTKPTISSGQYTLSQSTKITLDAAGAIAAVGKYYINKITSAGTQTGTRLYKIVSAQYEDSRLYLQTQVYYAARYKSEPNAVTIEREIPTLSYAVECNNRLWGIDTSDSSIRCSALANPKVWDRFDNLSDGCWQVEVGSSGEFTGSGVVNRKPVFAKEQILAEVFGATPTNFGCVEVNGLGVASGSDKSICSLKGVMFYLSIEGVMAYAGGQPYTVSREFGMLKYGNGVAGTDGRKYYLSAEEGGVQSLLVYDTSNKVWHKEDNSIILNFGYAKDLYALDSEGRIMALNPTNAIGDEEDDVEWYVEFNDIANKSPSKKLINKFQIRLLVEEGAACEIKVSIDGSNYVSVKQIMAGTKQSYNIPFYPRRADYYKFKIEGIGQVTIYSVTMQKSSASDY